LPNIHAVWPKLVQLRVYFDELSKDYSNLFKRCLGKSASAAIEFKFSKGFITIYHRVATFLHPSKRDFKGLNATIHEKDEVLNNT
jgi:hypothetical protein